MTTINISTNKRNDFINITTQIKEIINNAKIAQGICVIFCSHTTAGLTINENADPAVCVDIIKHLNKIIPQDNNFAHNEGNSDAHIKASLTGNSLTVIIENNELVLGIWQGIYLCEFYGPRSRQIHIKIIKG